MSEQENLKIMREFFEAAQARDIDGIVAFVGEEFVLESDALPAPMIGRQVYRERLGEFYRAFPDCQYEVEQMIASGDYVAVRHRLSGTHQGEFMGRPGSGRRFEYHLCRLDHLRNAKIVHTWAYYDTGHFLRQLGFVPTSGGFFPATPAARAAPRRLHSEALSCMLRLARETNIENLREPS